MLDSRNYKHKFITVCSFLCLCLFPFQLPAQEYWAGINELEFDGEHFYGVAERLYQIVKIESEGNVLRTFGKRGKGPKEFTSQNLKLSLGDSLLYVLDGRGMFITTLRKDSLTYVSKKFIGKPSSEIIFFKNKLYGYVTDFEENNPFETGVEIDAFRLIGELKDIESTLFKIQDPEPINPFYDAEIILANQHLVLVAREGKSRFLVFNGDSLYERQIPIIEKTALGERIKGETVALERPEAKVFWKKKIMPKYKLLRSAYLSGHTIYFQVHSYKVGNALISYNSSTDRFKNIGTLSNGQLIALKGDTLFAVDNNKLDILSLSSVTACADEELNFYFSSDAFEERCSSCSSSYFEWYDYAFQNNIPINLILEDNSWFGKEIIDAKTVTVLQQWGVWGKVKYKDDCEKCFDSPIIARISNNEFYTFPEPLATLKQNISCIE